MRKGWVLENFPETREQALALVSIGVLPKHTGKWKKIKKITNFNIFVLLIASSLLSLVVLQGSDSMLIERAAGKRVDAKTGGIDIK